MKEKIKKFLEKFNISYKERGDAIEFDYEIDMIKHATKYNIVISAFDDLLDICTITTKTSDSQDTYWITYDNLVDVLLTEINERERI